MAKMFLRLVSFTEISFRCFPESSPLSPTPFLRPRNICPCHAVSVQFANVYSQ